MSFSSDPSITPPQLPTRLFEINENFGKTIFTTTLPQDTKYCAVSHVWGSDVKNYPEFQPDVPWPVPSSSEHKVKFIVETCRKLGYKYVWCDILCIWQGRDAPAKEDQMRETAKMRQYYGQCDATIVFGSFYSTFATSWGVVDALLTTWEKDRSREQPETLKQVWLGLGDIDTAVGGEGGDQWFWRGWTLQETILPPRLLTSEGTVMRVKAFCELIDWTYTALGKRVLHDHDSTLPSYPWIHPGAGIVNDKGWWRVSQSLRLAFSFKNTPLDPLQALAVTAHREISPRHMKDTLFAAYGMIDSKWHVTDSDKYTLDDVWRLTVDKYIQAQDIAPLLAMAVTDTDHRTWAAGKAKYMGTVIPSAGKWLNSTAKIVGDQLQLTVPVSKLKLIPGYDNPYGDGSGELSKLNYHLKALAAQKYDISSVEALLGRATKFADARSPGSVHWNGVESMASLTGTIGASSNAVSSGLRAVFSGWDRWLVTTENDSEKKVFLAWYPDRAGEPKERLNANCWLLWSLSDSNEWAAIVEGDLDGCKKRGIAFTNFLKPPSNSESKAVVVL